MADKKAIIQETSAEAQYDATAKKLLSQKEFLANILVRSVKDFMGMDPRTVETLIEGEPYVGTVPVEPGFTNSVQHEPGKEITGMNTESKVRNEGVAYFDILFYVRTADSFSKIIINIEAQKSEPSEYDVELRGIFYAAREISSQLEREFTSQHYNDIKKVYSIWICMNEPENTMEKIYLTKQDLIGQTRWSDRYEVINVVIVRLAKLLDADKDHKLHRLFGALFLPEISEAEKDAILENEFKIPMVGERKELLESMCNLSQGIKEIGIEQGEKQGMQKGLQKGMQKGLKKGIQQGIQQGLEQGRTSEIFSSVQEGDYSVERGAQKLNLSVPEFEKQMTEAGYQIPAGV